MIKFCWFQKILYKQFVYCNKLLAARLSDISLINGNLAFLNLCFCMFWHNWKLLKKSFSWPNITKLWVFKKIWDALICAFVCSIECAYSRSLNMNSLGEISKMILYQKSHTFLSKRSKKNERIIFKKIRANHFLRIFTLYRLLTILIAKSK